MTTTATDLRNAAQYIRDHGWWQGDDGTGPNGQVCAVVAVSTVTSSEDQCDWALDALSEVAGRVSLFRWNDAPERTEAEVLAALEGAARSVEE